MFDNISWRLKHAYELTKSRKVDKHWLSIFENVVAFKKQWSTNMVCVTVFVAEYYWYVACSQVCTFVWCKPDKLLSLSFDDMIACSCKTLKSTQQKHKDKRSAKVTRHRFIKSNPDWLYINDKHSRIDGQYKPKNHVIFQSKRIALL